MKDSFQESVLSFYMNSGHQIWQQALLPTRLSRQPDFTALDSGQAFPEWL